MCLIVELVEVYEFGMGGGYVVGFGESFYCYFLVVVEYDLFVLVCVYVFEVVGC